MGRRLAVGNYRRGLESPSKASHSVAELQQMFPMLAYCCLLVRQKQTWVSASNGRLSNHKDNSISPHQCVDATGFAGMLSLFSGARYSLGCIFINLNSPCGKDIS